MQQRVNLARALVLDPQILLLDEPLASLDAQTREFMQAELLRVWRATRLTSLFVTHQIDEAVYLADRVVIFTARPARVREVLAIDLPRPRRLAIKREPRFLEYVNHVWAVVIEEARAMGMVTTEAEA
jgi:NitT/TauT family transport system ATP-binding protein